MRRYAKKAVDKIAYIANKLDYCHINDITNAFGIRVRFREFDDNRLAFSTTDGYIFIKQEIDWNLQLFLIAHEIGHLLLHYDLFNSDFEMGFNGLNLHLEKEANDFALLLLSKQFDMNLEDLRMKLVSKYNLKI